MFFVQHKTVRAEWYFPLWSGRKKEKYENQFLISWQSYLQNIFFKYLLSDTLRRLYNFIPCSCLTKILFGSLYAGTLLWILSQLVVGYLFVVAMYLHQYVVRLIPFACWRVPFFIRVPLRQYFVAPERVTN